MEVYDVEFSGARGDPIHAWFVSPPGVAARSTPVAVTLWGTAAAAACPLSLALPAAGIANFVMDTRGQGGGWTIGATGDPGRPADGPEYPGS